MHLHYSPFQWATDVEVVDSDVSVGKVLKTLKALTKKDTSKTHDMGSTMPCSAAAAIPGTPTAFISPNLPGVMKDLKMPMAPVGVAPAPTMRTRMITLSSRPGLHADVAVRMAETEEFTRLLGGRAARRFGDEGLKSASLQAASAPPLSDSMMEMIF